MPTVNRNSQEYTIWDGISPQTVTSSTDATPIVVTKTAHGYSTGDLIMISGHATNVAANGIYKITVLSSSTFSLQDINTSANIAGSGAGAGSGGVMVAAPKIMFAREWKTIILQVVTTGTSTMTVKVAASAGKLLEDTTTHGDCPNFSGTQSDTNPWQYVQIVDLDTGLVSDGATGIVVAGTDIQKLYEINVNSLKYLTLIPTAWTAGAITAKIIMSNNH